MRIGRAERGPAMTSWKPIEDAPKDGRSVLLWARLKTPPAEQDDIGYPNRRVLAQKHRVESST